MIMAENSTNPITAESGSVGPNPSSEGQPLFNKIKRQYPHIENTIQPFIKMSDPLAEVEEKLTTTSLENDPVSGNQKEFKINYLSAVSEIMDQVPELKNGKGNPTDELRVLNDLQDRVSNFGYYRTQNDSLHQLTNKYKDRNLLLAAIEFKRAKLLKQPDAQFFAEHPGNATSNDKSYRSNYFRETKYKVPEVIYNKKEVNPPNHPTNPQETIPSPKTLQEAAGLDKSTKPPEENSDQSKVSTSSASISESQTSTSAVTQEQKTETPVVPKIEPVELQAKVEVFPVDPKDKEEIPIETDQIRLADQSASDETSADISQNPDDSKEELNPAPTEEPEEKSIPSAPIQPEETPAVEAAPVAEDTESQKEGQLQTEKEKTKENEDEPKELTSAPAAVVPHKESGPKYKDGIILTAAAAQNRLEDQIKAQALHMRAEEPRGKGPIGWLRRQFHRTIQNRLLRNVFIGREMRYAADVDKVAKNVLGIGESVVLPLDLNFSVTALKEGMKRLDKQPWYQRLSKKLVYIPLRFISGTTGIIQSPDQWEARGWIKNDPAAKKMIQESFEKGLIEQDSLGKRFGLTDTSFKDINSLSIQAMNDNVLSLEKGETRDFIDLTDNVKQEIKNQIEIYAVNSFAPGSEAEMINKMELLTKLNRILSKDVFKNIGNKQDRNELLTSELASNILSIAEDIRANQSYYLTKGEDGKRKLDSLDMKLLAGQAWWGKARQAEATGIIGRSMNERMARRLSKRNYRWDRTGHKGINMVSNLIMDIGVNAGVYTGGVWAAAGENLVSKGARALSASPLGMIGGSLAVGGLNAVKESGVVWNNNGRLYGVGGNYLNEFVQYSHESSIGRENPANAKIRQEMEQIAVKRLSAEDWIKNVGNLLEDSALESDAKKRDQLLSLVIDAKARMRLTDISSKKEGLRLAAVQNFIQYKENTENEQAFEMHSLLVNAMSKLGTLPHEGKIVDKVRDLSLVRAAQLRMGDNIDGIVRSVNADLIENKKPKLDPAAIADLHHFLQINHLTVGADESLEAKNRLFNKLSRRKAVKAFVSTAVTAGVIGVAAPLIANAGHEVMEHGDEWIAGVAKSVNRPFTDIYNDSVKEVSQEFQEWRGILGNRNTLVPDIKGERYVSDLNAIQRAVLRARAAVDDVAPGPDAYYPIPKVGIGEFPPELKYVYDTHGHRAIMDLRTGDVLDFSGAKSLDINPDGELFIKSATDRTLGETLSTIKVVTNGTATIEGSELILKHTVGTHTAPLEVDGTSIQTKIPFGTKWSVDSSGNTDLIDVKNTVILIDNAHIDHGKLVGHFKDGIELRGTESVVSGSETKIVEGKEAVKAWNDMSTKMNNGERYWTNNTAGSDKNELQLHNSVRIVQDSSGQELRAVTLRANDMGWAKSGDEMVNATNIAQVENKMLFTFRLAGHYDEPIIVQANHGVLTLDPTDTSPLCGPDGNVILMNGHEVTVGEFSKMVLNQDALAGIPAGSLASEYTGRLDVFNLQPEGETKSGLIGAYFKDENGTYNSLAQIRGRGNFGDIEVTTGVHTDSICTIDVTKDIEETIRTNGTRFKFIAEDVPNVFTGEPWFTENGWPLFTPVPLYARQNIERSITSDGKKKDEPKTDQPGNEALNAIQAPKKHDDPHEKGHDTETPQEHKDHPEEKPAQDTPPVPVQSPDKLLAEQTTPVPSQNIQQPAPQTNKPVTQTETTIKTEPERFEDAQQPKEEQVLVPVQEDTKVKTRTELHNKIIQDEAIVNNPLQATPAIQERLANNRQQLQQLDAELGRGQYPNLERTVPEVRTSYFNYKQQSLPRYVNELRNDIRNAQSGRGMSYAEFEKKWRIQTGLAEYRLQSNLDETAVSGRLRQQFILNELATDSINKIPDASNKSRVKDIKVRIDNGEVVPGSDMDFYAEQVTQKVNQRVIDQQQFFNLIRTWEQERTNQQANRQYRNPLLSRTQRTSVQQAQSISQQSQKPLQPVPVTPTIPSPFERTNQEADSQITSPEDITKKKSSDFVVNTQVVDAKEAEDILTKTRIKADNIFVIENGKKVEKHLSIEDLKREGLEPKQKVVIDGVEVLLSAPYNADSDGRVAVVAYVNNGTETVARTYYRSNSQGTWRYLPHHAFYSWYGKGYSEESINVPNQIQRVLADMTEDPSKIKNINNPGLVFLGTARYHPTTSKYIQEEKIEITQQLNKLPSDSVQIQRLKTKLAILDEAEKEAKNREGNSYFLDIPSRGLDLNGNFYGSKDKKIPPNKLNFNNTADAPDFSKMEGSWIQKSNLYGDMNIELYASKNGQYSYMFFKDGNGRVWIGNVENLKSPITGHGIRRDWINPGDLTTPAYEYDTQTGGYGNSANSKGSYVDMWEKYLKNVRIIQDYLTVQSKRKVS